MANELEAPRVQTGPLALPTGPAELNPSPQGNSPRSGTRTVTVLQKGGRQSKISGLKFQSEACGEQISHHPQAAAPTSLLLGQMASEATNECSLWCFSLVGLKENDGLWEIKLQNQRDAAGHKMPAPCPDSKDVGLTRKTSWGC